MESASATLVCDIQRFSVHDGPGIRTAIFFKGCPLSCRWCHNPEAVSYRNQLVYSEADCIACNRCVPACAQSALALKGDRIEVDFSRCDGCLLCAERCPSGALAPAARSYDSDALLAAVQRDSDFYGDNGGVTLSGGEPLTQVSFLKEFLPKVKQAGLHVVAETAGHWSYARLDPVVDLIDQYLFDLKVVDSGRHRGLTGRGNSRILANLGKLVERGHDVKVRMPLIPGHNDDEENLSLTAQLLIALGLESVTLLPYHSLGLGKLGKVGGTSPALDLRRPTDGELSAARDLLGSLGVEVESA